MTAEPGSQPDEWLTTIAAFAATPAAQLDEDEAAPVIVRVLDAIACALLGQRSDAGEAALGFARSSEGAGVSGRHTVWGTSSRSTMQGAALANGVATRYLDYNDAYYGRESIHPTDLVPPLFALALERGRSGAELLDAIRAAYEVAMEAADLIAPRLYGFDHVNVTMMGAVTGAVSLMGLSEEQARHALSIAVTSHAALRQTRQGQLSMWKGFAAADACRHAVYASALAEQGVRGPDAPFIGHSGFFRRVLELSDDEFPVLSLPDRTKAGRIAFTQLKQFPAGVVGQGAIQATLALYAGGVRLDDVEALRITVGPKVAFLMVSPEKFEPQTRETADHSIPYIVVSALHRGRLDLQTFSDEAIFDDVVRSFLRHRVEVEVDESLDDRDPGMGFPLTLTVVLRDGREVAESVEHPLGSPGNPMSPQQFRDKFDRCVQDSTLAGREDEIWRIGWSLRHSSTALTDLDGVLMAH